MESLGIQARRRFVKMESHKLMQEFTASGTIRKGALVKLTNDGKVIEAAAADTQNLVIGVAIKAAIDGEGVTIMVKGYAIIEALAVDVQNAGPVVQTSWNATLGFFRYATATGTLIHGWALEAATAADQTIQILVK